MHYAIIGNSTAAIAAIEGIRERDSEGKISIISKENYHSYSRPLISYYMAGKVSEQNIYYRSQDFYEKNQVDILLGEEVTAIDVSEKKLHLKNSASEMTYDKLLLATGSEALRLSCIEDNYKNCFNFYTLDDVKAIKEQLQKKAKCKAVVVGGGLIGLKAAESLHDLGHEVVVVEAADHLLNSILDKTSAQMVKKHLEANGIEVLLSQALKEVKAQDEIIYTIILDNDKIIDCDLLILAVGVKPQYPEIKNGELKKEKGIAVNEYLETNLADIYAAGDVTIMKDTVSGLIKAIPILPNAYLQGRTAGQNMAGGQISFSGQMAFNSIPLLGLNIITAGMSILDEEIDEQYQYKVLNNNNKKIYKKLILENHLLKGCILIGDISRAGIYKALIEKKIDTALFTDKLLDNDFSLINIESASKL